MNRKQGNCARYIEELPEHAYCLHTASYEMRWSDMDAFGHVNNATYLTYFEQARIDWLRSIGADHGLVLANVSCTFLKPLKYPAALEVRLYAGRQGRSSLDTYYEIREHARPEQLCSIGHGTIVWYDHEAGCSVEIPARIRRHLQG